MIIEVYNTQDIGNDQKSKRGIPTNQPGFNGMMLGLFHHCAESRLTEHCIMRMDVEDLVGPKLRQGPLGRYKHLRCLHLVAR